MNPRKLEQAIEKIVGTSKEDPYDEYHEGTTGLNLFYHDLAGTAGNTNYHSPAPERTYEVNKVNGLSVIELAIGEFRVVETNQTYDEQGDLDCWVVFQYTDPFGETLHYQKYGALDSWEGGIWDGRLDVVKPVKKTITVWESA